MFVGRMEPNEEATNKYGHHEQFLFLIGYCLKKSSPLKLLGQMEPNLAGSIYVRSSIKLLHLVPFGQQTWPPRLILFSDWLMLKKSSPLKQLSQREPNQYGVGSCLAL
jgi:hypothetical protein